MKRLVVFLMILLLMFSTAQAGGLDGLLGNPTGGISDLFSKDKSLPDPFTVLEAEGTVLRENYEFLPGYFCTAYQYPTPLSTGHFISEYTPLATEAGYSVTEAQLQQFDGHKGYSVQNGDGKKAYLIFDVQGSLLFLVENGMDYQKAFGNSITIEYQGNTYIGSAYWLRDDKYGVDISYRIDKGSMSYFYITLPTDVAEGKEYYFTESPRNASLRMKMQWTNKRDEYLIASRTTDDGLINSKDYVRVVVERLERIGDNMHISGIIEAKIHGGRYTFTAKFSCMSEHCL